MARLLLAAAVLVAAFATAAANAHLALADLDPYRFQWNVTFALTSTKDKSVFVKHDCTANGLGKPCNQPAMNPDKHDKIQINITLRNDTSVKSFQTHLAAEPMRVVVMLCYGETSSIDRPWRKAKKLDKLKQACPIVVNPADRKEGQPDGWAWAAGTYNNHSAVYDFHDFPELTKAVWFARVMVKCKGGAWCQYDGTKGKNYLETTTIRQVTPGMSTVMIILSIAGPAFFAAFFVVDTIRRKNK